MYRENDGCMGFALLVIVDRFPLSPVKTSASYNAIKHED
jgi:hypothetical protein